MTGTRVKSDSGTFRPTLPVRPGAALRRLAAPLLTAVAAALLFAPAPAHALRVVTWNLFAYPDYNLAARQPSFRTVMANINADVLVVQELTTSAGVDSFQNNVLDVVQPGQWANSGFFTLQTSPAIEGGAIFYKPAKVAIAFTNVSPTSGPRDVLFTRVTPVGYTNISGTFRVYSVHFKAGGPGTSDSTTRRLEATDLRATLNGVPANTNFLVGGDTNIYGAYEGAYLRLTESQTDNDGRGVDPLNLPGSWHLVPSYSPYLTQCPCATSCGSFSGGGLDDRFDLFLSSMSMTNGQGVDVVAGGYSAYGNDGQHYNTDVNGSGFNNAVGLTVATALKTASDHLPVIITVQLASRIQAASALSFGSVLVGATAEQTLPVANPAVAPADALDYSFSAPAGFTAPAGSFSAAAGVTNPHTIAMSTGSVGLKSGTLNVATDAPDSLNKPVALSGTVLAHAVPSLDSLAAVVEDSLIFGPHATGDFIEPVRVHNRGYNSLQAGLELTNATITGPGAAYFSIIGGFSPLLIGGTGHSYEIRFDDAAAPAGVWSEATLTFATADEPLPGSAPQSDLVVHLKAMPNENTDVVPGPLPRALAFQAPRPNPLRSGTTFAFDLPNAADVSLDVFDLNGRRLASVVEGAQPAGRHEVFWTPLDGAGARLPAGLYFARFATGSFVQTRRIAVLP